MAFGAIHAHSENSESTETVWIWIPIGTRRQLRGTREKVVFPGKVNATRIADLAVKILSSAGSFFPSK